jgi:hypothetical protein
MTTRCVYQSTTQGPYGEHYKIPIVIPVKDKYWQDSPGACKEEEKRKIVKPALQVFRLIK